MGAQGDREQQTTGLNPGIAAKKGKVAWKRISVELIAIAVGVFLGLLADDYREHRADQAREREYLDALALDLDTDLETLEYTRAGILEQAQAADLIHRAVGGESVTAADIDLAFSRLILTWTFEPQRPTYLALRDGLGIHVISHVELRSALLAYYEVDQFRLQQDYIHNYTLTQQRVRQGLNQHVRFMPAEEFQSLRDVPEDFNVARLVTPIEELHNDWAFMNDLSELGGRAFELVHEIERVQGLNRSLYERFPAQPD